MDLVVSLQPLPGLDRLDPESISVPACAITMEVCTAHLHQRCGMLSCITVYFSITSHTYVSQR